MALPGRKKLVNPKQVELLDGLRGVIAEANKTFDLSWADVLGCLKELEFELMLEYLEVDDEDEETPD